jgi:hyperosmotically inducible protein
MQNAQTFATLVASAALAAALAATAAEPPATDGTVDRSNPSAYVKDSAITTKIKAKLAIEKLSSLATIHVDTDSHGVVWLSGTAKSQEQIDRVISIAKATENVRDVKSSLRVDAGS